MDKESPNNKAPEATKNDKDESEKSIEDGKKAIEMQKSLEDQSDEDSAKDAEAWRNEG